MGIVRLVLSVFLLVLGFFLYKTSTLQLSTDSARFALYTVVGIPFFWALFMFLSLFFKVKTENDGSICLEPGNPILIVRQKVNRITEGAFDTFSRSEFKPCPLYWGLSLLSFMPLLILLLVSAVVFILIIAPIYGNFWGLIAIGIAAFIFLILKGINIVINRMPYRYQDRIDNAFGSTILIIVVCVFGFILYASVGILGVLLAIAAVTLIFSIIIFVIGSAILTYRLLKKHKPAPMSAFENWLGNTLDRLDSIYIIKMKPRFCPTVKKCD